MGKSAGLNFTNYLAKEARVKYDGLSDLRGECDNRELSVTDGTFWTRLRYPAHKLSTFAGARIPATTKYITGWQNERQRCRA